MELTLQAAPKTPRNSALPPALNNSTKEIAARLLVKEQTVRAGYCRDGHYLGLLPTKLANNRLLWPAAEVDALVAGWPAKTPDATDIDKHMARKAADASKVPAHIRAKAEAKARRLTVKSVEVETVTTGEVA